MKQETFSIGTPILAIKNVGLVQNGQPGIITGIMEQRLFFFWKRPIYLCTFFGNVKAAMMQNEISDFDHGHSMEELEFDQHESLSVAEQMRRIKPLKD